jgi:hypothetical protein
VKISVFSIHVGRIFLFNFHNIKDHNIRWNNKHIKTQWASITIYCAHPITPACMVAPPLGMANVPCWEVTVNCTYSKHSTYGRHSGGKREFCITLGTAACTTDWVGGARNHRWASTSILMSAISDIRHRHLLFRYRRQICRTENCQSDIGSVQMSTSESIPISDIYKKKFPTG